MIAYQRDEKGYSIGQDFSSFGQRKIHLVNPDERNFTKNNFILAFGAYGWTVLRVWANCLDDALEIAAEWLSDHAIDHYS